MIMYLVDALQPALKLNRLEVGPSLTPGGERNLGFIEAYPTGLVPALKRLVGLGTTTTLTIGQQHVRRIDASRWSSATSVMPVGRLSTLAFGHHKSLNALVSGVTLSLAGIVGVFFKPAAIALLLIGGGLVAYYFVAAQVRYQLTFASVGGVPISIKLKVKDPSALDRLCNLVTQMTRSSSARVQLPAIEEIEPAEHTDRVPRA
jgi:hypothetical protein